MTVTIQLTLAGVDSGPLFNLYTDVDLITPFEPNVNKAALQAGYSSSLVPNTATFIRVRSVGALCNTQIDIPLTNLTTSTTSSSTSSTSTSSTSSTTTTTTTGIPVFTHHLSAPQINSLNACNQITFPNTVYSTSSVLVAGNQVFTTPALTPGTGFPGGGNFFGIDSGNAAQINGSGVLIPPLVIC